MVDSWINAFYSFLSSLGYSHPIHPALVHVPIGLVVGAFVFSWLAALFDKQTLARSARHCTVLAFLFWFPVVLLGLMDWQHFWGGAWLPLIKMKIVLAGILLILLVIALLFTRKAGDRSRGALVTYTLCFFTVVLLGYFGGQLVYGGKSQTASKEYKAGEKIFLADCYGCHPHGGNVIKPSKPVKNSLKLKDLDTFISWIRHPKSPMPPFPEPKISQKQTKELFEYIVNVLNHSSGGKGGT